MDPAQEGGQELFSDENADVVKWCHVSEAGLYAAGGQYVKYVKPRPTHKIFTFNLNELRNEMPSEVRLRNF